MQNIDVAPQSVGDRSSVTAPTLLVLAGANGAGKSSLGGAFLRSRGLDYFSAEDYARQAVCIEKTSLDVALEKGWFEGKRRLEGAIDSGQSYALETTLGGSTMPGLVRRAAMSGYQVHIWFFGLDSADQHVERVGRRTSAGGFPIPEQLVRARYRRSRENLIGLLRHLHQVRLLDNSTDRPANSINTPAPRLVLDVTGLTWSAPLLADLPTTPSWAKPVLEAAIQLRGLPAP